MSGLARGEGVAAKEWRGVGVKAGEGTEPRWGVAGRHGDAPDVVSESSVAEVSGGKGRGSRGQTHDWSRGAGGEGRTQARKGETPYGRQGEPKVGMDG